MFSEHFAKCPQICIIIFPVLRGMRCVILGCIKSWLALNVSFYWCCHLIFCAFCFRAPQEETDKRTILCKNITGKIRLDRYDTLVFCLFLRTQELTPVLVGRFCLWLLGVMNQTCPPWRAAVAGQPDLYLTKGCCSLLSSLLIIKTFRVLHEVKGSMVYEVCMFEILCTLPDTLVGLLV